MSSPFWTGRAEIRLEGDRLVAANGGWFTESGTVGGYLFRFVRDNTVAFTAPPPLRESHDDARARLAGNSHTFTLRPEDYGHSFNVEVYAVTFSGAWGSEPAWAEWGSKAATDRETSPNRSAPVFVPVPPEPPPDPPPSPTVTLESAQAKARAALYELVEERRRLGDSDPYIFDTLYYQLMKALGTEGAVRVQLKHAIRRILG